MIKQFQPSGKCGNCHWFKRSTKENDVVIEDADCRKGNDPKNCPPEEFMPRTKKKAKKKDKPWKLESRRIRATERRLYQ